MCSDNDLPGLLEGALSAARTSEPDRACTLMLEVFRHASTLPPEHPIEGPEELPAAFYANAAEAFLDIHGYAVMFRSFR